MGKDQLFSNRILQRNTSKLPAAINAALLELSLYIGKVSAARTTGFASPAQDDEQERLDLIHEYKLPCISWLSNLV